MKKLISILIFLFISNIAISQSGWYQVNSGVTANLNCVFFPSTSTGNIGYIAGDSGIILKTTNAGVSWFSVTADSNINFNSIHFINALTGWASGGSNISVLVYRTTNGGNNWVEQFNAYDGLCGVTTSFFTNESSGYIGGARRTLFSNYNKGFDMITTNGGLNWSKVNHNWNIYSVYFTNNNTGWRGAFLTYPPYNYGEIQFTTNGGTFWDWRINSQDMHFFAINFSNNDFGWAIGYQQGITPVYTQIYRTISGGYSWYLVGTIFSTSIIQSVYFISISKGWMCGTEGKIRYSDIGGNYWTVQNSGITEDLKSITFTDALTGYSVGTSGTILKTITGGLTKVRNTQNNIPKDYNLYQNYPNPFNPKTNIRFDIPRSSHVRLIVYDALGREVVILVNEKLSAGSYETEWGGSGYQSGVYFYKIETKDYSETKKMLLIK
jgi:photosystem II stability/assembly factor-like uncharacterized protein